MTAVANEPPRFDFVGNAYTSVAGSSGSTLVLKVQAHTTSGITYEEPVQFQAAAVDPNGGSITYSLNLPADGPAGTTDGTMPGATIDQTTGMFIWPVHAPSSTGYVEHLQVVATSKVGETHLSTTQDVEIDVLPFAPDFIMTDPATGLLVGFDGGNDYLTANLFVDYSPASHKTSHHGRARRIPLGPQAQTILRPYLDREPEAYCFSPHESRRRQYQGMRESRQTPVQPSQVNRQKRRPKRQPGGSYDKDSYNRAVARACDKADLAAHKGNPDVSAEKRLVPRWSPNRLRHSVGTRVRQRFGIEGAQLLLGHASANVTEVYAERDMAKAESESIALQIG